MAILKGYSPHKISYNSSIPPAANVVVAQGKTKVIDVRDRRRMGRVMLEFGSWAAPGVKKIGTYEVPSCGELVEWYSYGKDRFYYKVKYAN